MPPVEPYEVLMTGENSFIRLSSDGGKTMTTRLSHWRVLWCPDGSGHALFAQSDLTGNAVRIYSDNASVARWLQKSIESYLHKPFSDTSIPITSAQFTRAGDSRSTATEKIVGGGDTIIMTWYDCLTPFILSVPPNFMPERPIGVFSTFFPARGGQIEMNGKFASGTPWAEKRGDRDSSSACLAWSESWVKAR